MTGALTFRGIYAVLVGIYLGDCVTTAIVCSIGAKPEARRVGIVNILFNLSETVLVLVVVTVVQKLGLLDAIWMKPITSGGIANTNTIFNLGCAILLLPFVKVYEKLAMKIVKEKPQEKNKYQDKLDGLDPRFYTTPVLAFKSSYEAMNTMLTASRDNINKAFSLLQKYDEKTYEEILKEEENIDLLTDRVSNYLVDLSPRISLDLHVQIQNQYYKTISEFERLGDHAVNIAEHAQALKNGELQFSDRAKQELALLEDLIQRILDNTEEAFRKRDVDAARQIEPMEEVVDDLVNALRDNHLARLRRNECHMDIDNIFLNLLSDIERISDVASNIGIAVIARVYPHLASEAHDYSSKLHQGSDEEFNKQYEAVHAEYFARLSKFE